MSRVTASPTLKVTAEADRLRRQGVDVVDLGAGEPDFATPEHVKDAAHAALNANFTKYTPAAGVLELREAVCQRYHTDYGVTIKPDEALANRWICRTRCARASPSRSTRSQPSILTTRRKRMSPSAGREAFSPATSTCMPGVA